MEAEQADDEEMRNRLLGAAKILADATGKMVEAARVSTAGRWMDISLTECKDFKEVALVLVGYGYRATQLSTRWRRKTKVEPLLNVWA